MKVIIAGGRDFTDYETLRIFCDKILSETADNIEIVSGGARGTDKLGERYAKEKGYKLTVFPADWKNLGRKAGPVRNQQMADYATHLIAFWDKRSVGTLDMLTRARVKGLQIRKFHYTTIDFI